MSGLAPKRVRELALDLRQVVGAAPHLGRVALVVDDHDVADDARLVTVRGRVVEREGRDHFWIARLRDVHDGGAKVALAGQMPDIGIIAHDTDLPRAGEIEMTEPANVAGE